MEKTAEEREARVRWPRRGRWLAVATTTASVLAGLAVIPSATAADAPAESPLVVRIGDVTVVESASRQRMVAVPVSLSAPLEQDMDVMVVTRAVDAAPGTDYREITAPKRVRIRSGKTTAFAKVTVYGDQELEADERLEVQVAATSEPSVPTGATGTVTVADRTAAPADVVDVQIGSAVVHEADGRPTMAKIPISLAHPLAHDMTVRVETVDETAHAGLDHRPMAKDVRVRAGRVGATLSVPVFGDLEREGDERFSVVVTETSGGALVGARARGVVTIRDNEAALPPGPVVGNAALAGADRPGRVDLDWSAPGGIDSASKYLVEVRRDAGAWEGLGTTTDTAMSHDCGLYARTCTYRVTAIGEAGVGPATEIGTVTTQDLELPGAPHELAAEMVGVDALGVVRLRWTAPRDGGPVDKYRVDQLLADGSSVTVDTGTESQAQHDCGMPAVRCTYRVTAVNQRGAGAGVTVDVRTQDVPGVPAGLTAAVWSDRAVTVSWAPGTPNGGAPIVRYRVRMTGDLESDGRARPSATWVSSTTTATTRIVVCPGPATGLARCRIEVRAENAVGDGPWSNGVVVLTAVVQPPPKGGGGPAVPA
jgi:hypothetical protein